MQSTPSELQLWVFFLFSLAMSTSERSLLLKRLVHGALVDVCQVHFNYIDFVHVTGRLVFNVDNRKVSRGSVFLLSPFRDYRHKKIIIYSVLKRQCSRSSWVRHALPYEPPFHSVSINTLLSLAHHICS